MKVPAIIAGNARRWPDREAVVCGGARLTFRELNAVSDRLAAGLRARGVRPGDRIVLYTGNRVEFVTLLVAVLKAGGLAVPVSTRLVGTELKYIVEDAQPVAVVHEPSGREAVAVALAAAPVRLRIVTASAAGAGETTDAALADAGAAGPLPTLPPQPDDALINYTSGTTGFPKGAIVTHANLVWQTYLNAADWGLSSADCFLATTPLAHRTALSRLMSGLILGGTVVVIERFDAAEALRLLDAEHITVMGMVPTVARMLIEELDRHPGSGRSLRVAVVTGEAFPIEVKRRLAAHWPYLRMFSFFAMTEAGGVTSLGPEEQLTHPASVGRPIPGVEVRLVDDKLCDVAIGEVGEILVRAGEPGRYMTMRGYWNQPKATAESIVDGFIRTGDLGRFDADGYLYVVDRAKDMILSGGLNIYSKEVERTLESHPAVAEAAVIGVPDGRFGEAVCAYVILRPDAAVTAEALIEHCRTVMASYKKPKHVRLVDALPRNAVGKVLKAELRARERLGTPAPHR